MHADDYLCLGAYSNYLDEQNHFSVAYNKVFHGLYIDDINWPEVIGCLKQEKIYNFPRDPRGQQVYILFCCFCLLRTLETSKNIYKPVEAHRGGGFSKQTMRDFLQNRRFYAPISTSKSEFVSHRFLHNDSNVFFSTKIKGGATAIDALSCLPEENLPYSARSEMEITLPPGVVDNMACIVYRKSRGKSSTIYRPNNNRRGNSIHYLDPYGIGIPHFLEKLIEGGRWLEAIALYAEPNNPEVEGLDYKNIREFSAKEEIIDYNEFVNEYAIHFFGTYIPDYKWAMSKLRYTIRSLGKKDQICEMLLTQLKDPSSERIATTILNELLEYG